MKPFTSSDLFFSWNESKAFETKVRRKKVRSAGSEAPIQSTILAEPWFFKTIKFVTSSNL
jgi:hypothetical protein